MAGAQADIHTKILTASTTEELMGIYHNWAQGSETQLPDEWVIPSRRRRLSS